MHNRIDILHDAIADVIESELIRSRYTCMEDVCTDLEIVTKELKMVASRMTRRKSERSPEYEVTRSLQRNFEQLRESCNKR